MISFYAYIVLLISLNSAFCLTINSIFTTSDLFDINTSKHVKRMPPIRNLPPHVGAKMHMPNLNIRKRPLKAVFIPTRSHNNQGPDSVENIPPNLVR
jgi:hypothetical protein